MRKDGTWNECELSIQVPSTFGASVPNLSNTTYVDDDLLSYEI